MFEFFFKYSLEDYFRSELVFVSEWPFLLVVVAALIGVFGIAFGLGRRLRHQSWGTLFSLGALQLVFFGLVLFVLLQPTLKTEQLRPGDNAVALVLDTSQSMSQGEGTSELEAGASLLDSITAQAGPLFVPLRYQFGDGAEAVDGFAALTPSASETALAESLIGILESARQQALAGVVIATDGADTTGLSERTLATIAGFGVPIHTLAMGREAIPADIQLDKVILPGEAPPNSTVTARLSVRHDRGASARVKVYSGEELIASKPVELSSDTHVTATDIELDFADTGGRSLRFLVDAGTSDSEPRNNVVHTGLSIVDQSFDVLYFEGEPRWEYKFLRRALETDPHINLVSMLRVSENKFYRQGLSSAEQLKTGFPQTTEELFSFDAVIIGSLEAALLSEQQLQNLRDFVGKRGGTLMLLAGPRGLGNGGWGQTTVADALPVSLPSSSVETFFRDRVKVSLTQAGRVTPTFKLSESDPESGEIWKDLPEIANYQNVGPLKPAATSWLEAETIDGPVPILVSQPYGQGKGVILATAGTWRWQMGMPFEDLSHEKFWQQLLRFMVVDVLPQNTLVVNQNRGSSLVSLRANFRDQKYDDVDDLNVTVVASNDLGDSETLTMIRSPEEVGTFVTDATLDAGGTWYFEVLARREQETWASIRQSHFLESGPGEYFRVRRDTGLLKRLSDATGGSFFEPENALDVVESLRYSSSGIKEFRYRSIWDAPVMFLLLILIKSGEWLLRRRWRGI
ncbi:MAG: hypothetical protein AAF438_01025 [Pseudomonadota bacterium]